MRLSSLILIIFAIAAASTTLLAQEIAEEVVTYKVRQTVTINQIEKDADRLRMWVAIPSDEKDQDILDLEVVETPGLWRFVRDEEQGNRYLLIEAKADGREAVDVVVDFVLKRKSRYTPLETENAAAISSTLKKLHAPYLRRDEPHMEVTETIEKMAKAVCGDEKNISKQVSQILAQVCGTADHYSLDPTKPNCGIGDAGACITNGGGCCTDLHSLFIALCRARGIPARLQMGYRLLAKNVGKEIDPGYRCWVEYFVPGSGWVSADLVEADAAKGIEKTRWLSGLSARRLWLNQGRDFRLADDQAVSRVNHMSIAYAEIDGVPARLLPEGELKPQIHRKIRFDEVDEKAKTVKKSLR